MYRQREASDFRLNDRIIRRAGGRDKAVARLAGGEIHGTSARQFGGNLGVINPVHAVAQIVVANRQHDIVNIGIRIDIEHRLDGDRQRMRIDRIGIADAAQPARFPTRLEIQLARVAQGEDAVFLHRAELGNRVFDIEQKAASPVREEDRVAGQEDIVGGPPVVEPEARGDQAVRQVAAHMHQRMTECFDAAGSPACFKPGHADPPEDERPLTHRPHKSEDFLGFFGITPPHFGAREQLQRLRVVIRPEPDITGARPFGFGKRKQPGILAQIHRPIEMADQKRCRGERVCRNTRHSVYAPEGAAGPGSRRQRVPTARPRLTPSLDREDPASPRVASRNWSRSRGSNCVSPRRHRARTRIVRGASA